MYVIYLLYIIWTWTCNKNSCDLSKTEEPNVPCPNQFYIEINPQLCINRDVCMDYGAQINWWDCEPPPPHFPNVYTNCASEGARRPAKEIRKGAQRSSSSIESRIFKDLAR